MIYQNLFKPLLKFHTLLAIALFSVLIQGHATAQDSTAIKDTEIPEFNEQAINGRLETRTENIQIKTRFLQKLNARIDSLQSIGEADKNKTQISRLAYSAYLVEKYISSEKLKIWQLHQMKTIQTTQNNQEKVAAWKNFNDNLLRERQISLQSVKNSKRRYEKIIVDDLMLKQLNKDSLLTN